MSRGWFYGFKLHLIVNDAGELLAWQRTLGTIDDRRPVPGLTQGLLGQLLGDRGSISPALHDVLWTQGLALLTQGRKNIRKRTRIETINDQLQNISPIEHTRHRSVTGCMVHLVAGLVAYSYRPKQPSLGLRRARKLSRLIA